MTFYLSRSALMSRIRSRGNRGTELALAKLFRQVGITGWRRNQPIFGKPDFVFPKPRVAVFVDGCFWHGCRWHCTYAEEARRVSRKGAKSQSRRLRTVDCRPKTGRAFWLAKLAANKRRDRLVTRQLRRQGWTVIRIWEHELTARLKVAERVREALNLATKRVSDRKRAN